MGNRILVVDDEKEIADVIELYLKNEGFEVEKFYTGKDALVSIEKASTGYGTSGCDASGY